MTTQIELPARWLPNLKPAELLTLARHGLAAAADARPDGLRYATAHLAALRAAAAVLASRARPTRGRADRAPDGWALLVMVAPELEAWATHFSAGAPKRAAAEAGIPRAVSAREADDLVRAAGEFVAVVEASLGLTHQPATAAGPVAANGRPLVLVASPIAGHAPAIAEVWEDKPGSSVVKVVYTSSRTAAQVARRRIIGPTAGACQRCGEPTKMLADLVVHAITDPDHDPVLLAVEPDQAERRPGAWRKPRTLAVAGDLFPVDTEVWHLNPEFATWQGVVESMPETGRHIEVGPYGPLVRVRWTCGPGVVGWYSAACIEPEWVRTECCGEPVHLIESGAVDHAGDPGCPNYEPPAGAVLDADGLEVAVPDGIDPEEGTFRAWMAGRVRAGCGHYIAASERRAGFDRCERCPANPADRCLDA